MFIAAAAIHKSVWKLFENRKLQAEGQSWRRNWAGLSGGWNWEDWAPVKVQELHRALNTAVIKLPHFAMLWVSNLKNVYISQPAKVHKTQSWSWRERFQSDWMFFFGDYRRRTDRRRRRRSVISHADMTTLDSARRIRDKTQIIFLFAVMDYLARPFSNKQLLSRGKKIKIQRRGTIQRALTLEEKKEEKGDVRSGMVCWNFSKHVTTS